MTSRGRRGRLAYFTIEDESMLAEAFADFEPDVFAITYKVAGTEDIFVTTAETREAMDRHDVPYNLLGEEDPGRIALFHTAVSRDELGEYEDAVKALALAYRAIALACVGINGEANLGFDLSVGTGRYSYFTVPAGHTFIWRLFHKRDEASKFLSKLTLGDREAVTWARSIPLSSSKELASYQ